MEIILKPVQETLTRSELEEIIKLLSRKDERHMPF